MDAIWKEALSMKGSVRMENSVITKGIKTVNSDEGVRFYSTETDFYEDITDTFLIGGFEYSLNVYLRNKYLKLLDRVERSIQKEIDGRRNHKRYNYLKKMRQTYLNKYNEINT